METKPRVALLIDADNSPASKIDLILNELSTFGETNIRRAYGNWKKSELKGWEEALHEHAIRPMQQFDYTKGKNASDMAMVIDALELLYTDRPDAFGIVSSDADFTPGAENARAFCQRLLPLPVPGQAAAHGGGRCAGRRPRRRRSGCRCAAACHTRAAQAGCQAGHAAAQRGAGRRR